MSLYPSWYKTANDWTNANIDCLANMNDMVSRYGKEVMIVECGMSWDNASTCKSFLTDLISKTKSVTGGKGTGVFYWEPQSYGQWKAYTLGAFDNSGKPTIALDAFKLASEITEVAEDKSFYKWDSAIHQLSFTRPVSRMNIYDSKGKLLFSEINIQKYQNTELKNGVFLLEVITESSERKASKLIF
jgi:arabinogalactan endo-1,4-beta-galactosidase